MKAVQTFQLYRKQNKCDNYNKDSITKCLIYLLQWCSEMPFRHINICICQKYFCWFSDIFTKEKKIPGQTMFLFFYDAFLPSGKIYIQILFYGIGRTMTVRHRLERRKTKFLLKLSKDKSRQFLEKRNQITTIQS